jgi:protocatechuate 3,4-dioxygenase, alpha subunit
MDLITTTSQTVGPFFHIGLDWLNINDLIGMDVTGERITIEGKVVDGDGKPIPDALIEIWQANTYGKYIHPEDTQNKPIEVNFRGYGRIPTDDNGVFRIKTIKPGRVPGLDGALQAPHIAVNLFMRGLLKHLVTRIYFSDETSNAEDVVLNLIDPNRRSSLIAKRMPAKDNLYEWNICVQGKATEETVFFDC